MWSERLKVGKKKEHDAWEEKELVMMSPGPTQVSENVRRVRSFNVSSPILDERFFDFYRETCQELGHFLGTKNPFYIMNGEGILGLEAACASLTELGDRVLVIDNGVFGRGFADFVTMYGGQAVLLTLDYHKPVEYEALKDYLEKDHAFKYATLVHSDTPSGVLNPIETLCPLLKSYGILTVVDSVTGMFGETLSIDEAQIDIACGGSQKALSAPPGLTMVSVSPAAKRAMHARKTPIASFYANILTYETYYEDQHFPYTQPVSDIMGFRAALEDCIADENILYRHKSIAAAVRAALTKAGITLYLTDGYASTVTAFCLPKGVSEQQLLQDMMTDYRIMISGSLGSLKGKLIRIGHMGNNANVEDVAQTLRALTKVLKKYGVPLNGDMEELFLQEIEKY